MELATQEPEGLRISASADQHIVDILCAVLRGDEVAWPPASADGFYTRFLELAAYHGVDVLAWHLVRERGDSHQLPNRVQGELAARTMRAVAIEMVRANDIRVLQQQLARAGIVAILLKGGALAYTHYPAPHMRSRVDTDIFIGPRDIRHARGVFQEAGYRLEGWIYKSRQFKALRDDFGGYTIKYDVHWRSSNRSEYARILGHGQAWNDSAPIPELEGFRALSPRHALIQACIHRAASRYHDPDRLIWLYDVHLLLSGMSDTEARDFASAVAGSGVQDVCLETIETSRRLFDTAVKETVLTILREPVPEASYGRRVRSSQLGLIIDDLRELPDFRSRLEMTREFLFPPGAYLLQRYEKKGGGWVPILYLRYLATGLFERFTLR